MDTERTAQSVPRKAAGGKVFVTAGGCEIVAKLHRKAVHVGDVEVKVKQVKQIGVKPVLVLVLVLGDDDSTTTRLS